MTLVHRLRMVGAAVALIVGLAACGGSGASGGTGTGGSRSAAAELPAARCDKTTGLTLYAALGYDADMAKAFTGATGINVKLVDDSTGPLLAKVAAEGANPQWDAIWFDGGVTMQDLANHGYLLKWTSPNLKNYTAQGSQNVPADRAWYPTGITAPGVIVYNKTRASATLPADWGDLLKPAYRNMTAENDPAFSGTAYPMIAGVSQIMGGEDQGKQFFTNLKDNGVTIFKTNRPTLAAINTGSRAFGIIQDGAYYAAVQGGASNLGVIYPKSGVVEMASAIGVAANGSHQACAQQFVDFVLSRAGQTVAINHDPKDGDTWFQELISGVSPVVQRQTGFKWVAPDVARWASVENEYKTWFNDHVVNG